MTSTGAAAMHRRAEASILRLRPSLVTRDRSLDVRRLRLLPLSLTLLLACWGGARETRWENGAGETLLEVTGSQEHCGWESVSFLYYGERRYIADPEGAVVPSLRTGSYRASTELPDGAEPTGFREGERELWTVPGDFDAVYVVDEDGAARWPEMTGGCA